jgi:hypothetical protein
VRSRANFIALTLLVGLLSSHVPAAEAIKAQPPKFTAISAATMDAAIADLRLDPNLGGQSKIRTLRWTTRSQPRPASPPAGWIIGLFDYIGQFGGLLLWIGGAVAAALAVIWGLRLLNSREPRVVAAQADSGVKRLLDLDISPDSLPTDVSAAATELLRVGRLRECLSLLYRASLSCAVHRFGAALGAHNTEREALKIVKDAFDGPRARYFTDLVMIWQQVVYAGKDVSPDVVLPLCGGYSTSFDPPPP